MSPAYTSNTGLLTAVGGNLPRVQIVHPGTVDITTYNTASGTVQPGDMVELVAASATKSSYTQGGRVKTVAATPSFASGASRRRYGVAMKQVQANTSGNDDATDQTIGPVELVNGDIVNGEFVRIVHDGTLATTVVDTSSSFLPGDLVTWDPSASRPSPDQGSGAWSKTTDESVAFAECVSFKSVGSSDGGILYMRLLS